MKRGRTAHSQAEVLFPHDPVLATPEGKEKKLSEWSITDCMKFQSQTTIELRRECNGRLESGDITQERIQQVRLMLWEGYRYFEEPTPRKKREAPPVFDEDD